VPDVVNRPIQKNELGDVLLDKFEVRIAAQMRDIVDGAGHKIIDTDNLVSARKEQVGQMRTEEAGSAGNDTTGLLPFTA